jgi:hypothetical protein
MAGLPVGLVTNGENRDQKFTKATCIKAGPGVWYLQVSQAETGPENPSPFPLKKSDSL